MFTAYLIQKSTLYQKMGLLVIQSSQLASFRENNIEFIQTTERNKTYFSTPSCTDSVTSQSLSLLRVRQHKKSSWWT